MMKKGIKIIVYLVILIGLVFSIFNIISLELKAFNLRGEWVDVGGDLECLGNGNECGIGFEEH
jgi:hypothetical protein